MLEAENLQSSGDAAMLTKQDIPEQPRDRSGSAKRQGVAPQASSGGDDLAGFIPEGLTGHDIEIKLARVVADLDTEISKRRDLRDELERQSERLTETRQHTRNNSSVIKQCISILGSEGQHLDSVRILVIKKKGCTMRNF
jgi:hypothetical protein